MEKVIWISVLTYLYIGIIISTLETGLPYKLCPKSELLKSERASERPGSLLMTRSGAHPGLCIFDGVLRLTAQGQAALTGCGQHCGPLVTTLPGRYLKKRQVPGVSACWLQRPGYMCVFLRSPVAV